MEITTYEIVSLVEEGRLSEAREVVVEMCPEELSALAQDIELLMLVYTEDKMYNEYRRLLDDILSCAGNKKGTIQRIIKEIDERVIMNNGEADEVFPEEIENF